MDTPFDFKSWCETKGLKKETSELLTKQDLNTKETLVLVTESDIANLEMTLGQRKLLVKEITELRKGYNVRSRPSHHKVTGEGRWPRRNFKENLRHRRHRRPLADAGCYRDPSPTLRQRSASVSRDKCKSSARSQRR